MRDRTRREAVLEAATALVARPSENPPGEEAAVAEWLVDRLDASPAPFAVETSEVEPGRPNVVARAGDPERGTVLLTGHTDVVPAAAERWTAPPYEPEVRDGRLFGRGTSDMKGALAAMVVAAERYLERERPGEVVLAFAVDEEDGGRGTRALVEGGLDADVAIVGEPTELHVCTAIKGVARYELTVTGESCHSGTPEEGRDAIAGLRELLDRVADFDDELAATDHAVLAHEDATVTEVSGGLAPNVVADRATATLDWRFLPGRPVTPDPFDDRVAELVTGLSADDKALDVDVDRTVFARAAETDPDHPAVATVLDAAREQGVDAELVGFNAATDARFLVHDAEIPTLHFGPGSITDDAHTVDESVAVDDLVTAAAVYETALDRLL